MADGADACALLRRRLCASGGRHRLPRSRDLGYEFVRCGRAKEAERALEEACLARFGTLRAPGVTPVIRSDNGLVYQSRRFRVACRKYRRQQELITHYTPEQNGIDLSSTHWTISRS